MKRTVVTCFVIVYLENYCKIEKDVRNFAINCNIEICKNTALKRCVLQFFDGKRRVQKTNFVVWFFIYVKNIVQKRT